MLIIREWDAMGEHWCLARHLQRDWFYLIRNGRVIEEGGNKKELLEHGWYA